MDKLQTTTGLTDTGRSALIQLANPFSDFEFTKAGYYDTDESSSIVQCIKYSAVVTAPAGLAAGATWDANIFNTPSMGSVGTVPALVGGGSIVSASGAPSGSRFGAVVINTGPAGVALNVCDLAATATSVSLGPTAAQTIIGATSFLDGTSRVIGLGFEVHNTTAEINKQGAVAVYRVPQTYLYDRQSRNYVLYVGPSTGATSTEFQGSIDTHSFNDVPSSLSEALLLSGTRQWEAKDGAMLVPTLVDDSIPVQRRSNILPVCVKSQVATTTFTNQAGQSFPVTPCNLPVASAINMTTPLNLRVMVPTIPDKYMNFNSSGAYFTGLSYETSLVVNLIMYIERFPSASELDLVVLANPSPPHDPVAKLLYSEMTRSMPIGVKVRDNASGDWFFELVSGVSKVLAPGLSLLGGPWGQLGAAGAAIAGNWADEKLKKKPQNTGSSWGPAPTAPKPKPKPSPQIPSKRAPKPLPPIPQKPKSKTLPPPKRR